MSENTFRWKRRGRSARGTTREFTLGEVSRLCDVMGYSLDSLLLPEEVGV